MEYNISEELIKEFNNTKAEFPKYTTQIMNLASGNAGATRPRAVGQMSELFPEYINEAKANSEEISVDAWSEWYLEKRNKEGETDTVEKAVKKVLSAVDDLRGAIDLIDEELVTKWVEDLLYNKTYNGLYVQEAIFKFLAMKNKTTYRMATPEEEAKNIDGFLGEGENEVAYQIKSDTYLATKRSLMEEIPVKIISYEKKKQGLKIYVED